MTVDINPIVLSFGPLAVRWFGLLALLGVGVAIWGSLRELDRQRLGRRLALDALAWGLPAGIVCARVVYVLGYWDYYLTNASELWQLDVDGLSLWGGLGGGMLVATARLGRDRSRRRRVFDAMAPYAMLGIAIGRVGAFLDGHGQGLPTQLPWATEYANRLAATPDFGVARHPAQLYDALIALALFGIVVRLPRSLAAGTRLAALLVAYGVARVALSPLRLDPTFLFGLQIDELLAIGAVAVGLAYGIRPLLGGRCQRSAPLDSPDARPKHGSLAA